MSRIYCDKILVIRDEYVDERYMLWVEGHFNTPLAIMLPDHARQLSEHIETALARKPKKTL